MMLEDKVAIVTGAGQGIGEAIARTLAKAGAKVAINDLNPDRAERVVEAITADGGEAVAIVADIGNKFQCVHLVETTRDAFGHLDILVNNAGIEPVGSILKLDEWDWDRCLEVNLKGTFMMSQMVGRVMSWENGGRGGAIVNIASTAGVDKPLKDRAAYCAAKAGIVGFAKECAREFADYGIRVNTILPGFFDTQSTEKQQQDQKWLEHMQHSILLGRLGYPNEVAQAALYLCSDMSSYVTGTTITVNGGYK